MKKFSLLHPWHSRPIQQWALIGRRPLIRSGSSAAEMGLATRRSGQKSPDPTVKIYDIDLFENEKNTTVKTFYKLRRTL